MPHDENGKHKVLYYRGIQNRQLTYIADAKKLKRMCETSVTNYIDEKINMSNSKYDN